MGLFSRKKKESKPIKTEENNSVFPTITAEVFLEIKKNNPQCLANVNVTGVYILTNITTGKSYVGQATRIVDRINNHLTGRGNGDVYADFKYGQKFAVTMVPLVLSGFADLDSLEKHFIKELDAYNNGYNRNQGNSRH